MDSYVDFNHLALLDRGLVPDGGGVVCCDLVYVDVTWERYAATELPREGFDTLADVNRFDSGLDLTPDLLTYLGGDLAGLDVLLLCLH